MLTEELIRESRDVLYLLWSEPSIAKEMDDATRKRVWRLITQLDRHPAATTPETRS